MMTGAKAVLTLATVSCALCAHADVVTVTPSSSSGPLFGLSGTSTLSFSEGMLQVADTIELNAFGAMPGQATSTRDIDSGWLTSLTLSSPVASVTLDTNTKSITGWTGNGGVIMATPYRYPLSGSGSLTLANLSFDVATKQVYADVLGANGVGARSHVNIMSWTQLETSTQRLGSVDGLDLLSSTQTLKGLSLTTTGFDLFVQSLQLISLGKGALAAYAGDFGSLETTMQFKTTPGFMPAVPEPSTYSLMGLGLVGLLLAKKRHKSNLRAIN